MPESPQSAAEVALEAHRRGYRCVPILPGCKVPAVKWKSLQDERPTEAEIEGLFAGARLNVALLTTGLVVFDCDDPDKAGLVLEHCGETPYQVRTPRGGLHLGYRARRGVHVGNHVKIKGQAIDIRAENGLALLPPSYTEHGCYHWLGELLPPRDTLPLARIGWTRERQRRQARQVVALPPGLDQDALCRRVAAYVARIDPAVSGQRGHDRTFYAACRIVELVRGDRALASHFLQVYNARCEPPWSERELLHKLDDALAKYHGR